MSAPVDAESAARIAESFEHCVQMLENFDMAPYARVQSVLERVARNVLCLADELRANIKANRHLNPKRREHLRRVNHCRRNLLLCL